MSSVPESRAWVCGTLEGNRCERALSASDQLQAKACGPSGAGYFCHALQCTSPPPAPPCDRCNGYISADGSCDCSAPPWPNWSGACPDFDAGQASAMHSP